MTFLYLRLLMGFWQGLALGLPRIFWGMLFPVSLPCLRHRFYLIYQKGDAYVAGI